MNLICTYFVENLYPVQTKIIVADFSDGRDIYNRIRDELSSIPVGILGKYVTIDENLKVFLGTKIFWMR